MTNNDWLTILILRSIIRKIYPQRLSFWNPLGNSLSSRFKVVIELNESLLNVEWISYDSRYIVDGKEIARGGQVRPSRSSSRRELLTV
ncbi:MAG: hypothetical protein IJQ42_07620 [Oscillospiraceae bacterium]|nr:hypothetical protein [Oscillospiraceae bacterium]